jgi:hypothetical protein
MKKKTLPILGICFITTIVLLFQKQKFIVMSLVLPLIGMGISAIGAGINSYQNAQANSLAEENYNKARGRLLTDMHTNPLDLVSNKALFSKMDRKLNKQEEKIANAATAGGATFENVLAAKQASNDVMADVYAGVLQGEQARQDAFRNQLFDIESRRTAQQIAAKQASGANWANLASGISGSLTTLGGTMLDNNLSFKDLLSRG